MRILWLSWKSITHPDAGGAEIVGHENAKALVEAGHSVTWISLNPSSNKYELREGIHYQYIGKRWMMYTGFFHILVFINYIINWKNEYDFIIEEIHGPPLITPFFVREQKIIIIHEVAGEIWQKTIPQPLAFVMQHFIEPLMFKIYRNETFVIGAETTKEDLIKIGTPEKNIKLVPYGVEIPSNQLNFSKEIRPTLIFLSALRPMKGFNRVYQAFKRLHAQLPDLQLWVVGDDTTEHAVHMKSLINKDNPENSSITFFGKVSQQKKFELLQRAHILVHGSYKEGWGLVVIEANAVGTPAVVFDAAGLRNSIKQGENGYLSNNEDEFISYIKTLFEDHSLYSKMSQNAVHWSSQFSWQKAKNSFLNIFNEIA